MFDLLLILAFLAFPDLILNAYCYVNINSLVVPNGLISDEHTISLSDIGYN